MPPVHKSKPGNSRKLRSTEVLDTSEVVSGQLDKKLKKQEQKTAAKRGVVFIKHLPHGFFEEQLQNYFEQFGKVTRLRLSRSRRTGGSRGFAFIEFEYPEVAQVAAETMDNYLMFKKVVKAAYIPPEKQIYNYFKTSVRKVKNKAGKELFVSNKTATIHRKAKQFNNWSDENYQRRTLNKLKKVKKLNEKYSHLGIDFSSVLIGPKKIQTVKNIESDTDAEKHQEPVINTKKFEDNIAGTKKKLLKKTKKDIELRDLLGTTINDDSTDEDYVAMSGSDNESTESKGLYNSDMDEESSISDEEAYGFMKDEDEIANKVKESKKAKTSFGKSIKPPNLDRFEQLIKRKPHTGAVRKAKKALKPAISQMVPKSTKQVMAAKEMLKNLSATKTKSVGLKSKSQKQQKLRK